MSFPRRQVIWRPCYRVIPTRYPSIDLFERVADPSDWEALIELESLTNPRIRNEVGQIHLVAPEERVSGPNTGYIMASFTHLNPEGSRFSNGSYGVFYAAKDLGTAIRETCYHHERRLRETSNPEPMEFEMRALTAHLDGELHDIRGLKSTHPELYHPTDYSASQVLGICLRNNGSWGIAFDSVRHAEGECVAVFRPRALSDCRHLRHLSYVWDGVRITHYFDKELKPLP